MNWERIFEMNIILASVIVVVIAVLCVVLHKNGTLTKALDAATAQLEKLNITKDNLESTIAGQAVELEGYRPIGRTIEEASQRAKQLEEAVSDASGKLEGIKAEIEKAHGELAEKKRKSEELEAEVKKLEDEISRLKAEYQTVSDRLFKLQGVDSPEMFGDISQKIQKIDSLLGLIDKDRNTARELKIHFGSRLTSSYYYQAYMVGLDENSLIVAAYGLSYKQHALETGTISGPYFNLRNDSVTEFKKLAKNPAVATWVVIGMIQTGKASFMLGEMTFVFPSEVRLVAAELTPKVIALYSGDTFGGNSGRLVMLEEKQNALETKRAELVAQLDELNAAAAIPVGIDAILGS